MVCYPLRYAYYAYVQPMSIMPMSNMVRCTSEPNEMPFSTLGARLRISSSQSRVSGRDREFCLSVSLFGTRMGICPHNLMSRDDSETRPIWVLQKVDYDCALPKIYFCGGSRRHDGLADIPAASQCGG